MDYVKAFGSNNDCSGNIWPCIFSSDGDTTKAAIFAALAAVLAFVGLYIVNLVESAAGGDTVVDVIGVRDSTECDGIINPLTKVRW